MKKIVNVSKIAEELSKGGQLETYWDYRDKLSDEQCINIINEEDGLSEVENEVFDNDGYTYETITDAIDKKIEEDNLELTDEEKEELRYACEERFEYNFNGLIKNSEINIRVQLETNENMIDINDIKNSDTLKAFKKVFKGKYKKEDLDNEIANAFNYAKFAFYFKVKGEDILKLREQVLKGYIELRKGLQFGLFDNCNGGGSLLEMELLKNIKLSLKDWRFNNINEEIVGKLDGVSDMGYYSVNILSDEISSYGIQETYGLCGWQEF